jgi:hypothetical protein
VAREPFPSATHEPRTDMLYLNAVALVPYIKALIGSWLFISVVLKNIG